MNTPENIIKLKPHQVFVFGSNEMGNHAGGAAKTAYEKFGAIMGQSEGLQGQSYGINTMSGLNIFREQVARFLDFAIKHPELTFYLTRVGTGIAGYFDHEVNPMFKDAPKNVIKPKGW